MFCVSCIHFFFILSFNLCVISFSHLVFYPILDNSLFSSSPLSPLVFFPSSLLSLLSLFFPSFIPLAFYSSCFLSLLPFILLFLPSVFIIIYFLLDLFSPSKSDYICISCAERSGLIRFLYIWFHINIRLSINQKRDTRVLIS